MSEVLTTTESAPVDATENATEVDANLASDTPVTTTAPAKAESKQPSAEDKQHRLFEIEKKIAKDPRTVLNDEDQALYEEFVDGKLTPKERKFPDKANPEIKDKETDTDDKAEKVEKTEKPEKAEIAPEIAAAMKEVGAKSPAELAEKIKGLRAVASGKETEAVTALKTDLARKAENTEALIRDLVEGKPGALEFVERNYGLKARAPQQQTQTQQPASDFDPEVLADADALTGGITSKVIAQNKALQERLERLEGTFQTHQKSIQEQGVRQTVAGKLVDEMIAISANLDGVKDIPGLRNVIIDRVVNGKEDPRLDAFNDLFQIAEEKAVNGIPLPLGDAFLIKQGRDMAFLLEKAKEEGRASAYQHKPNKSLSGIQTEDAEKQTYTEGQLDAMEKDYRLQPKEWFDANGNLSQKNIPKKHWARFGF